MIARAGAVEDRRAVFATASADELFGELARRGTLVLRVEDEPIPVGLALEAVERARRVLPLVDLPEVREGELADLEIATPGEIQGRIDQFRPPSWTALLYRALVEVVWADSQEDRRRALVELAAVAVRWVEALDAREPVGGGER